MHDRLTGARGGEGWRGVSGLIGGLANPGGSGPWEGPYADGSGRCPKCNWIAREPEGALTGFTGLSRDTKIEEMNIHPIDVILDRIASATRASPIAVFKQGAGLASVFGGTLKTWMDTQERANDYVGSFHRGMDPVLIKRQLEAAIRETDD